MSNTWELADAYSKAVANLLDSRGEAFFAHNGWVFFGHPACIPNPYPSSKPYRLFESDIASHIAEACNKAYASARVAKISDCEEKLRETKNALRIALDADTVL